MKLGLLICDHVADSLQGEHGTYPEMFRAWLDDLEMEVFYVVDGQFPASPESCDAWLINGSRHSVYEDLSWIKSLAAFVREIYAAKKPCVGVCFGHQMIAHALGGNVAKSDAGWCVGIHRFQMTQHPEWVQPVQETLKLLMMCQDQVLQLPPDGKVIASAPSCSVGILQVGETMLGIQAHPEFSTAYDRVLMEARVDRMGEEVVRKGIASLTQGTDSAVIGTWVKRFLATAQ